MPAGVTLLAAGVGLKEKWVGLLPTTAQHERLQSDQEQPEGRLQEPPELCRSLDMRHPPVLLAAPATLAWPAATRLAPTAFWLALIKLAWPALMMSKEPGCKWGAGCASRSAATGSCLGGEDRSPPLPESVSVACCFRLPSSTHGTGLETHQQSECWWM